MTITGRSDPSRQELGTEKYSDMHAAPSVIALQIIAPIRKTVKMEGGRKNKGERGNMSAVETGLEWGKGGKVKILY